MNKSAFDPLDLLFVGRCASCGALCTEALCKNCMRRLRPLRAACCPKCGKPAGACICNRQETAYTRCISAFRYEEGPVRALVYRLKTRGSRKVVSLLSGAMLDVVAREYDALHFDAVTYVPTAGARLREKGFDQAQLLAAAVARALRLPLVRPPVKKHTGRAQKYLSRKQRTQNAAHRFYRTSGTLPDTVLLIDDVLTTGATVDSCAALLRQSGAREVYVLTAATSGEKM